MIDLSLPSLGSGPNTAIRPASGPPGKSGPGAASSGFDAVLASNRAYPANADDAARSAASRAGQPSTDDPAPGPSGSGAASRLPHDGSTLPPIAASASASASASAAPAPAGTPALPGGATLALSAGSVIANDNLVANGLRSGALVAKAAKGAQPAAKALGAAPETDDLAQGGPIGSSADQPADGTALSSATLPQPDMQLPTLAALGLAVNGAIPAMGAGTNPAPGTAALPAAQSPPPPAPIKPPVGLTPGGLSQQSGASAALVPAARTDASAPANGQPARAFAPTSPSLASPAQSVTEPLIERILPDAAATSQAGKAQASAAALDASGQNAAQSAPRSTASLLSGNVDTTGRAEAVSVQTSEAGRAKPDRRAAHAGDRPVSDPAAAMAGLSGSQASYGSDALPAAAANAPLESGAASSRSERIGLGALVDAIARARDDAAMGHTGAPVAVALTHAEFGKVSLRFTNNDDGLAVSMASADPGFSPAALAAGEVAARAQAGTGAGEGGQPQSQSQPQAQTQAQTQAQSQSSGSGQSGAPFGGQGLSSGADAGGNGGSNGNGTGTDQGQGQGFGRQGPQGADKTSDERSGRAGQDGIFA
ncbi:hypothetical protein [Novosphingobium sp. FKTRR1]|uniref:hypothetical protein n=1 Tax=Novosphingobium sp. FKTRR1 TaxID=2879118 RepID=UPI001CF007DB|nr:hypothetical protein [Novosphingobium sp. FKTRR1]